MATVSRAHLAQAVREEAGLTRRAARDLVGSLFDEMAARLVAGEQVESYGFGSFGLREKAERAGRNRRTLAEVHIAARRVAVFRATRLLKERVADSLSGGGDGRRASGVAPRAAAPWRVRSGPRPRGGSRLFPAPVVFRSPAEEGHAGPHQWLLPLLPGEHGMKAPAGLDELAALHDQGTGLPVPADQVAPPEHEALAGNGRFQRMGMAADDFVPGAESGRPTASNQRSQVGPSSSDSARARKVSAPQLVAGPFRTSA